MVKRCVHKETRMEYAAKIFNTRKLTARGICIPFDFSIKHSEIPKHCRFAL